MNYQMSSPNPLKQLVKTLEKSNRNAERRKRQVKLAPKEAKNFAEDDVASAVRYMMEHFGVTMEQARALLWQAVSNI